MRIIETRNLSRIYVMGNTEVRALQSVSISIEKGEYVAFMGPSGSGKSTLMNIIGCLDTPTGGTYMLNNQLVSEMTENELAEVRNRNLLTARVAHDVVGIRCARIGDVVKRIVRPVRQGVGRLRLMADDVDIVRHVGTDRDLWVFRLHEVVQSPHQIIDRVLLEFLVFPENRVVGIFLKREFQSTAKLGEGFLIVRILIDAMVNAQVGISGLVSGHVDEDAVYWIAFNDFVYDPEHPVLFIGRVDGHDVQVVIDNSLPFWRKVKPVGMFIKNTLVCATEIKTHNHANSCIMAFLNHIAQHVRLHVRIGVVVFEFGGIEGHDASRIDDKRVGGKVLQVRDERIDVQVGLVCRQVGL